MEVVVVVGCPEWDNQQQQPNAKKKLAKKKIKVVKKNKIKTPLAGLQVGRGGKMVKKQ